MTDRRTVWLIWALCAVLGAGGVAAWVFDVTQTAGSFSNLQAIGAVAWGLLPVVYSLLAGVILTRQPRNLIGWLLMMPAFTIASSAIFNPYLIQFAQAPAVPTPALYAMTWYASWAWLLLVIPLLLIPLYFPTGRPPGRRWRWVGVGVVLEGLAFVIMALFATELQPVGANNVNWSVTNPIGFVTEAMFAAFLIPWSAGLGTLLVLSMASLIVRYRRAGAVERTQIRWLLYACGLFALNYGAGFFVEMEGPDGQLTQTGILFDAVFVLTIVAVPVAIAIAVLRYRLWDIDILIRRTLVYSVLTTLLALVYFGSVVVLQAVFRGIFGQTQSSIVVVVSTLIIAALFTPLRSRVQSAIDRRFYRSKYDAARTLAQFGASLRNQTDLASLSGQLTEVVQETMQPQHASLWLRPTQRR